LILTPVLAKGGELAGGVRGCLVIVCFYVFPVLG